MALALLERRAGRLLAHASCLAEACAAVGELGRSASSGNDDSGTGPCSTSRPASGQASTSGGGWPRWGGQQLRAYAINNKPAVRYVPVPQPQHDDFSAAPTTYTQLLASIRSAKHVERLLELLTAYADRLDTVHVAAAAARLPALLRHRSADMVDQSDMVVIPTQGLPRARRKHGAKLPASNMELATRVAVLLDELLPAHVQHFFPRQAACTVWAFGELRRAGVVQRMKSLPDVLLSVAKGNMEPLRVHGHAIDFAQLLQGLAKLGYTDPALLKPLLALVKERLGSLPQRELQMVAWSAVCLGVTDQALYNRIADQLRVSGTAFMRPSGLASVFWSFAKVDLLRPDLFADLASGLVGQSVDLAPQDAVTTLWACSRLRYQHTQLFGVLCDSLVRQLDTCSDLEVSSALEALAGLGYTHTPLLDAAAEAILAEPVIKAQPVCVARALFAYGRLGRTGPRETRLATVLAASLAGRTPLVRADVLAMACRGLAELELQDKSALSAFAVRAEMLLPSCTTKHLLPILRCLDRHGHAHYQLAVATARHLATSLLPQGRCRGVGDAAELVYLCARQGVEDKGAADELFALAAAHEAEMRGVDAARLLVVAQRMNRAELFTEAMAAAVVKDAAEVERRTAQAALQSANALARKDVAAALAQRLQRG